MAADQLRATLKISKIKDKGITDGFGATFDHLDGQGLPEPGWHLISYGSEQLPRYETEVNGVTGGVGAAFHPLTGQV